MINRHWQWTKLYLILIACLWTSLTSAQSLKLEEATIRVYHYGFKRSGGTRGGDAYDKHLVRTNINGQGWNCARINSGNNPGNFYSLGDGLAGSIDYKGESSFNANQQ